MGVGDDGSSSESVGPQRTFSARKMKGSENDENKKDFTNSITDSGDSLTLAFGPFER